MEAKLILSKREVNIMINQIQRFVDLIPDLCTDYLTYLFFKKELEDFSLRLGKLYFQAKTINKLNIKPSLAYVLYQIYTHIGEDAFVDVALMRTIGATLHKISLKNKL